MTGQADTIKQPILPGRQIAILAMIGSAACWGLATVMSRDLLSEISPLQLLVVQLTASVMALLLLAAPRFPWRYQRQGLTKGAMTGLLEPGLTYVVGLVGLSLTTAGSASVISATEPVLIVLLSWRALRVRPEARLLACVGVAVAGLILVSWAELAARGPQSLLGDLLVVLATLFAAGYVVLSSRIATNFPAATLASAQQIVGLLFVLAVFAISSAMGKEHGSFMAIPLPVALYAALSGIVQYALAFWLYLIGLRHLSANTAGLWLALTPVFGLAGAWIWLAEVPSIMMFAGALLIIAAIVVGNVRRR